MFYLFFKLARFHIDMFQLQPYYIASQERRGVEVEASQRAGQARNERMFQALMDLGMGPSNSEIQSLEEEVDSYLAVPSREEWDSIAFWEVCYVVDLILDAYLYDLQANQNKFPTLFKLAMDILSIQASSVPCERVFSSSKETITARRNALSPPLVEALQLLKYATKQGKGISFSQGLEEAEELAELERREAGESVEELNSYLRDFLE